MLQTVRAEKVDEKMESFVWFPCSLPELWSLNCLRTYIYASVKAHYVLSENCIVYYAMTYGLLN